MSKKGSKKCKKIFLFVLNKNQSVTHVSTTIFQWLLKNLVIRTIDLVTKMLWFILDFLIWIGLFTTLYPMHLKKFFLNPLNFYPLKKFTVTLTVSKMRVQGQKNLMGGGSNVLPPDCLGIIGIIIILSRF